MADPPLLSAFLLLTSIGFVTNDPIGKFEYNYSVNREKLHQQERAFAGYRTDYTEVSQSIGTLNGGRLEYQTYCCVIVQITRRPIVR